MPRGGFTGRLREASSRGTQLKELVDVPPELENIFTLFDVEVSPEEEGDEETVGVHSPIAPDQPDLPDRYGRKIIHLREDGMLYPTKDVSNICLDVFHKIVLPDAFFQKSLKQHHIEVYWMEFKKHANVEKYDQNLALDAFKRKCKVRYGDYISKMRKAKKKPTYFPDAVWNDYCKAWNTADAIKASKRCSNNRRQGKEKALGTHANGCVAFDVTAKKMVRIVFSSFSVYIFNYC
ncbi:uncharacterized protein LOC121771780 [Salvia splendens]|uniref:uncharacterized protein LOC121771780 n=1 Tax=Salvia splendens TaxID=180675 RepID=UPI001C252532|nr:uncharacterized protein LOC121771780 [Salvia splendens]